MSPLARRVWAVLRSCRTREHFACAARYAELAAALGGPEVGEELDWALEYARVGALDEEEAYLVKNMLAAGSGS